MLGVGALLPKSITNAQKKPPLGKDHLNHLNVIRVGVWITQSPRQVVIYVYPMPSRVCSRLGQSPGRAAGSLQTSDERKGSRLKDKNQGGWIRNLALGFDAIEFCSDLSHT